MKKTFISVFSIMIVLLFSSCVSAPVDGANNIGMIENATPENSVLVYGMSSEPDIQLYYVDENNNWEALISTGNRYFSLPPAHKGGKLVVKGSSWQKSLTTTAFLGNMILHTQYIKLYEVQNDEWTVNVPKDKSLYFMGLHSLQQQNIMEWESLKALANKPGTLVIGIPKTEEEYKAAINKYELKSLNTLLKKYKGTVWEPVINERISELKNR
ncbi:hypothetical protein HRI96_00985 [Treponema parvum]|uniref:Lipoprotein n=1 Tax=Treponema parvum TaxID=138851 RepID=A0A975IBH1_9SPIR|nr:hypothetical protein [Treponema parvum]QTQ10890.1 hypothetical protein HRI96_00985 [Treponema parvum]